MTATASSTEVIVLAQSDSSRRGRSPGSTNIAETSALRCPLKISPTTIATALSFSRLLRNSVQPRGPNVLTKPLRIDRREKSGMIRVSTIRGAFCKSGPATPNAMIKMTDGARNRAQRHHDDLSQPEDVGRTLQPPPRGIVDEVQKHRNQAGGRRGQREQCDEQIRRRATAER